jgi:hypothetical protein
MLLSPLLKFYSAIQAVPLYTTGQNEEPPPVSVPRKVGDTASVTNALAPSAPAGREATV